MMARFQGRHTPHWTDLDTTTTFTIPDIECQGAWLHLCYCDRCVSQAVILMNISVETWPLNKWLFFHRWVCPHISKLWEICDFKSMTHDNQMTRSAPLIKTTIK